AVDRRVAPADHLEALGGGDALKHTLALQAAVPVDGKEAHGHAVGAFRGQLHVELAEFARKENVWNLNQDSCAIPGFRIATGCPAMGEVQQNLEALADDFVALLSADAGYQPHATGIVLILRVIESLRVRDTT